MADALYTPDTEDVEVYFALGLVEYSPGNGYDLNAAHDGFRRWLAAHVADEVERLADEIDRACQSMPNWPGWTHNWDEIESFAHGVVDSAEHVRARAAELRKEQTDGQ